MTTMRSAALGVAASLLLIGACASRSSAPAASTVPSRESTIGKFVWHDLSTDNVTAAQQFYGSLLGWQFRDETRNGRPYVLASYKGRLVGGIVAVNPVTGQNVSQWVGFTSVGNVDDSVAAVEKAGGRTLIAPMNVGSAGRAAVVTDPQGAPLGLVRLAGGDPADLAAPAEGTIFWMEYLARDQAAAVSFYTATFGYQSEVTERLGPREYVVLSRGRPRGGILQAPDPDIRTVWLPSILVNDPVALAARTKTLGGTVLLEPQADVRKASVAVVADPTGAIVALQKFPF